MDNNYNIIMTTFNIIKDRWKTKIIKCGNWCESENKKRKLMATQNTINRAVK